MVQKGIRKVVVWNRIPPARDHPTVRSEVAAAAAKAAVYLFASDNSGSGKHCEESNRC